MIPRPPCPLPGTEPASPASATVPGQGLQGPPPVLTLQQAQAEAARCLSLGLCLGCEVCELLCPDQAISRDPQSGQRVIDLAYCKGCGLCAHLCPKGAIVMEPEL